MTVAEAQRKFPGLILPKNYHPQMDTLRTAHALQEIRKFIALNLETEMHLHRVSAPLFVEKGTGINDELSGIERPVSFPATAMVGIEAEVVQSLAKWKRMALKKYDIKVHEGIYANMHAIRPDEQPDNLHSLFVDQWDWEQRIEEKDRNLDYLKKTVKKLYFILKRTETYVEKLYGIQPQLPEEIRFIHSEELLQRYPDVIPEERERKITKEYGAVFIIGIGGKLSNDISHGGRSPDYDDWITPNKDGFTGLNGDILIWNPVLNREVEFSSMGIRVSSESLRKQLEIRNQEHRKGLLYHKQLLNDELPLCIGGGIGQSRLGMYFLRKAHVGEISVGIWPQEMIDICAEHNIDLL